MKLNNEIKIKLTERFLRTLGEPLSDVVEDIYVDLCDGKHEVYITMHEKFTIAEIVYHRNNYAHHFLGVTSKHPNDEEDTFYAVKVATEKALMSLFQKFYFEEQLKEGY